MGTDIKHSDISAAEDLGFHYDINCFRFRIYGCNILVISAIDKYIAC